MSPEDLQKFLTTLNATLQQFAADVEKLVRGLPAKNDSPSILTVADEKEKQTQQQEDSADLTSNQEKKQLKIAQIFSKQFDEVFKKYFDNAKKQNEQPPAPSADESEVATEAVKIMDVNIASIDEKVLKSLKETFDFNIKQEKVESGGILGFLTSIIALGPLAGASLTALAAGIGAMTAALAGIGAAAGPIIAGLSIVALAIPAFALSFSLAAGVIVGALWLLKEPLLELMPVFEMFGKLFKEYILQPVLDTLPDILLVLSVPLQILKDLVADVLAVLAPILQNIMDILKVAVKGIVDLANGIVKGVVSIITAVAGTIDKIVGVIATGIKIVSSTVTKLADIFSNMLLKSLDKIKEGMILFRDIFLSLPSIIDKIFESITKFSNTANSEKITAIGVGLTNLAGGLVKLTGAGLLESITSFFADSPFDKIIDFQNQLDQQKIGALLMLATAMEKLSQIKADALNKFDSQLYNMKFNVDKLADAFDNLMQKMPGESAWATISNFSVKTADALNNLFKSKQQAEIDQTIKVIHYNADSNQFVASFKGIGDILIKSNDAQVALAKVHIDETRGTNKILNNILQKMQDIKMPAVVTATQQKGTEYKSFPLQYTATQTRQQMLAAGYS